MKCPFCGYAEDKVIDSRVTKGGEAIRRRRECLECGRRYTTYERIEEFYPRIIKRDGVREDYDRAKIDHGIKLACSKRPISTAQLDEVVRRVENRLIASGSREIESEQIGAWISDELRELDPVAYVRFASVYRGFDDIGAFLAELRELEPDGEK